ncbi:MAG: cupin domain-containing protein [Gemmatimonadetes bacterium]|nr:MAG: cupin domain-containing protein [Gemmatimonadota bacterium]
MLGERATERAAEEAAGGAEALAPAGPTALPSTPGASASPPRGALRVIDLAEHFGRFEDRWTPKLVAEMNGQLVKLAKGEGDIVWHSHEHEDEFFLVVAGELTIHLRDGALTLGPGQCAVVPAGVEHRASAAVETHIVLIEPASTRHTGEVESEQTVSIEDQEWLL